jgi:hypothetical protein
MFSLFIFQEYKTYHLLQYYGTVEWSHFRFNTAFSLLQFLYLSEGTQNTADNYTLA